jgi:hypothetical protein
MAAANSLLDRGHGKAPQTYEVTNYDVLTDAELDRVIVDTIYGHLWGFWNGLGPFWRALLGLRPA